MCVAYDAAATIRLNNNVSSWNTRPSWCCFRKPFRPSEDWEYLLTIAPLHLCLGLAHYNSSNSFLATKRCFNPMREFSVGCFCSTKKNSRIFSQINPIIHNSTFHSTYFTYKQAWVTASKRYHRFRSYYEWKCNHGVYLIRNISTNSPS